MKYFLILSTMVITVAGSLTALAGPKISANDVMVWNQKKGQMENLQSFLDNTVIYYDSVNVKLCVRDERGIELCTASLTPSSIGDENRLSESSHQSPPKPDKEIGDDLNIKNNGR